MHLHRVETQNRGFVDISMGAMLPAFFAELFLVNLGCSCTSFLKKKPHEALPAHRGPIRLPGALPQPVTGRWDFLASLIDLSPERNAPGLYHQGIQGPSRSMILAFQRPGSPATPTFRWCHTCRRNCCFARPQMAQAKCSEHRNSSWA